jgi:hypothetical protein
MFLRFNESKQKLSVEANDININGVQVLEKENGTLIRVSASRKFTEKDIVLDIRYDHFHIDVYGGKINPERFATIPGAGVISKVEGIQLGETASLVFKLKGKIITINAVN